MQIKQEVRNKFPIMMEKLYSLKFKTLYRKHRNIAKNRSPEALIRFAYQNVVPPEHRYEMNLVTPKTFHEKMNWLKLHWYDERAVICSDKYLVRKYIKEKGLGHLLNELYAVYDDSSQIDFRKLPNKFVMKPTHDSGHVILCDNKASLNENLVRCKLKWWLDIDYCYMSGEWAYHTEKPRIVCERYLSDEKLGELVDYKFFCFNGKPSLCFFASDRSHHAKADFYNMNWEKLPFRWMYEPSGKVFDKPENFEEMKRCSTILAEGFPFVRVDFYEANGQLYFGELTFFHGGGCAWFEPKEIDFELGEILVLPNKTSDPWSKILRH